MIEISKGMSIGINNSYVRLANEEDVLTFQRMKIITALEQNSIKEENFILINHYIITNLKLIEIKRFHHIIDREIGISITREESKDIKIIVCNNNRILIARASNKYHKNQPQKDRD